MTVCAKPPSLKHMHHFEGGFGTPSFGSPFPIAADFSPLPSSSPRYETRTRDGMTGADMRKRQKLSPPQPQPPPPPQPQPQSSELISNISMNSDGDDDDDHRTLLLLRATMVTVLPRVPIWQTANVPLWWHVHNPPCPPELVTAAHHRTIHPDPLPGRPLLFEHQLRCTVLQVLQLLNKSIKTKHIQKFTQEYCTLLHNTLMQKLFQVALWADVLCAHRQFLFVDDDDSKVPQQFLSLSPTVVVLRMFLRVLNISAMLQPLTQWAESVLQQELQSLSSSTSSSSSCCFFTSSPLFLCNVTLSPLSRASHPPLALLSSSLPSSWRTQLHFVFEAAIKQQYRESRGGDDDDDGGGGGDDDNAKIISALSMPLSAVPSVFAGRTTRCCHICARSSVRIQEEEKEEKEKEEGIHQPPPPPPPSPHNKTFSILHSRVAVSRCAILDGDDDDDDDDDDDKWDPWIHCDFVQAAVLAWLQQRQQHPTTTTIQSACYGVTHLLQLYVVKEKGGGEEEEAERREQKKKTQCSGAPKKQQDLLLQMVWVAICVLFEAGVLTTATTTNTTDDDDDDDDVFLGATLLHTKSIGKPVPSAILQRSISIVTMAEWGAQRAIAAAVASAAHIATIPSTFVMRHAYGDFPDCHPPPPPHCPPPQPSFHWKNAPLYSGGGDDGNKEKEEHKKKKRWWWKVGFVAGLKMLLPTT